MEIEKNKTMKLKKCYVNLYLYLFLCNQNVLKRLKVQVYIQSKFKQSIKFDVQHL